MIDLVKRKIVAIGNTIALSLAGITLILPGGLDIMVFLVAIGVFNIVIKVQGNVYKD